MKAEIDFTVPLPLTLIGCSIAFYFAGAHLTTPWAFSFPLSILIDLTMGFTLHVTGKKLRKK